MKHKILFILILTLLIGFGLFFSFRYTGLVSEYIPPSEQGTIKVYFCPRDNCKEIFINLIKSSYGINCALYDLGDIINTFEEKNKRFDVKIVTDNFNKINLKGYKFVKFDNNNQLMHNKFCIFSKDEEDIILTGSLNPTENGFNKNKNNLVVIKSKFLAENYNNEFNELWNGVYGSGNRVKYPKINFNDFLIENYFCPEDSCEEKVFNIIKNAENRIYFMTFSFTSDILGDAIISKSLEGIEVKGLFDDLQNDQYSEFIKMKNKNLNVKIYKEELMHHKVFIVDEVVIFGSYNPTKSGNEKNDENMIIIHNREITNQFIEEFNSLFENGK